MNCTRLLAGFIVLFQSVNNYAFAGGEVELNSNWRFLKADTELNADTATWDEVSIPHTWNAVDALNGGGTQDKNGADGYYRGPGWYAKTFPFDDEWKGKRVFIRFEGVGMVADVYLNGHHLGQHKGAFGAFCYELTQHLISHADNELRVHVNNSWQADIPPLSGDFPVFGGIYRPVSIIVKEPTCITPLDYASSGVYIIQKQVRLESAEIEVLVKVNNGGKESAKIAFACRVIDGDREVVKGISPEVSIESEGKTDLRQTLRINNPRLWHGRRDPHLYAVEIKLMVNGTETETLKIPLGLRFYRIDPEKGFFLNGEPYRLYGVNRHQDRAGKGWAISTADHQQDHEIIMEIGARAIRLAHYPQASAFYSLCDHSGLLVWAEIPVVDCISDHPDFAPNASQQLVEMIRQHYNHPSIFTWGLFNELYNRGGPNASALLKDLQTLAKSEDSTRPTTCAVSRIDPALCNSTDILAFNSYPGWYGGTPDDMGNRIKNCYETGNRRGVAVSEYGAGASIHNHEQNPKHPKHNGPWHPEEWQTLVHEGNYADIKNAEYCWGSFVWNMFDFASVWRNEGDTRGMNDKGLVTYDRKTRKDAFYFYKANWSEEPVVYITSRRHAKRTEPITDIKVYSNAESVELSVNGIAQDSVTPDSLKRAVWKKITLKPGENIIEAVAQQDGQTFRDSCKWTFTPAEEKE